MTILDIRASQNIKDVIDMYRSTPIHFGEIDTFAFIPTGKRKESDDRLSCISCDYSFINYNKRCNGNCGECFAKTMCNECTNHSNHSDNIINGESRFVEDSVMLIESVQ